MDWWYERDIDLKSHRKLIALRYRLLQECTIGETLVSSSAQSQNMPTPTSTSITSIASERNLSVYSLTEYSQISGLVKVSAPVFAGSTLFWLLLLARRKYSRFIHRGLTRCTLAQKLYPPKSNTDLQRLYQDIIQSKGQDHQQQAVIYYITLDCHELNNLDENFARKVFLPSKYKILMNGLWKMDQGYFHDALEELTDPSLTPTFTDEILHVLIKHSKADEGLAQAYYNTVSPPLADRKILMAYFSLLSANSVAEAYLFAQKQDARRHQLLFQALLMAIHSHHGGPSRASRAVELISQPFTEEEEAWFEEFLLHGDGSHEPHAKDSVLIRRIAIGKSHEGVGALDRLRGQQIRGINWDDVRASMAKTAVSM